MFAFLVVACVSGIGSTFVSLGPHGESSAQRAVYSPYPSDLVPPDVQAETNRVNGEIDGLEQEAMAQWQALPKNSGTAMRQIQLLGKLEMYDKNLSVNRNQACTFCHMSYTGFSGPISSN